MSFRKSVFKWKMVMRVHHKLQKSKNVLTIQLIYLLHDTICVKRRLITKTYLGISNLSHFMSEKIEKIA